MLSHGLAGRLLNRDYWTGLVNQHMAISIVLALHGAAAAIGTCPSPPTTVPPDLAADRAACTAACNTDGYCCTTEWGGCQNPTCTAGCHFAWYSASESACVATCTASKGTCEWSHAPSNDIATHVLWQFCQGPEQCGCPESGEAGYDADNEWGTSNDCGGDACAAGCAKAANVYGHSFYGRSLTTEEITSRTSTSTQDETAMSSALDSLEQHVSGGAPLSNAQLASKATLVSQHAKLLGNTGTLITQALDLVDSYESSSHGPLFVNGGDFPRGSHWPTAAVDDARDTDRAMLMVQQALIDHVYGKRGLVAPCSIDLFRGRSWQTASYFPGALSPPLDPSVVHTVTVDASHPQTWGHPVGYSQDDAKKPTGLYLAPGQPATVTVPSVVVSAGGFKVLVGAHDADNTIKDTHLRMDRITIQYVIASVETTIVSPLGGGVYMLVPYLSDLKLLTIQVTGGVVAAPFFQRTHFRQMSNAEWANVRGYAPPWADLETDKFMLTVPSSWISVTSDPTALLAEYDTVMDGVAECFGYPPRPRELLGVHTFYLQPDLHIKHPAYGCAPAHRDSNLRR